MNKKVFKKFLDKQKSEQHLKFYSNDKLIDVCQRKFKVQYEDMKNLRKNLDAFVFGIKNLTAIIENLYDCFKNIYEPDWHGNADFHQSCQQSMKFWRNFIEDFKNSIQTEFEKYTEQFPEIKRSIDACNKKAAEYYKQKGVYDSYRNNKKPDSGKIKKAGIEMKSAQDLYNESNDILKSDLPQFCDSRIQVYIHMWSLMFRAEDKLYQSLQDEKRYQMQILNDLNDAASHGQYNIANKVSSNENHTNTVYDKKKATSVMSLFSSERRPLESNLIKGGSVWELTSPDEIYDQINITKHDESSLTRNKSYQIGTRTSSENLEFAEYSTFTNTINRADAAKKKISFDRNSSPTRQPSVSNVPLRPSPPISTHESSDVESDTQNFIYAQLYPNKVVDKNAVTSPTSVPFDGKKPSENTTENYNYNQSYNSKVIDKNAKMSPTSDHFDGRKPAEIATEKSYFNQLNNNKIIDKNAKMSPPSGFLDRKRPSIKRVSISVRASDIYETEPLQEKFYHQVMAKYNYSRQDEDELNLRKDDIIMILPWEHEDQKEDGWLYGENVLTKEKGLFPENHTSPI